MVAAATLAPPVGIAHEQSDVLWNVIALLEGARETPFQQQGESGDRLIRQAIERLQGVQTALDPHI